MPSGRGSHTLSTQGVRNLRELQRKSSLSSDGGKQAGGSHQRTLRWYFAKATSSITPGTFESPTTFTFDVWLPDPSDTGAVPAFIQATDTDLQGLTGVNRTGASGSSDLRIKVEFAFGNWHLVNAECEV